MPSKFFGDLSRLKLFCGSLFFCLALHGGLALLLVTPETRFVKYPQAAAQSLAGVLPAERLADLSPGYFYLHLAAQWLGAGEAALPVLLLQLLLTALTGALLALLLFELLSSGWAVVGAMLFAFSHGVIVYTGMFEPEVLLLFLLVAMVWLLLRDGRGRLLAAGGMLGLALLTRPSVTPLLVLVPLAFLARRKGKDWLCASGWFLLLPGLALVLLAGRNAVAFGSWSPTVMNPGFVFFEGNNPLSNGQSSVYPPLVGELKTEIVGTPDNPHVTYRALARRSTGQALSIAETNAYWGGRALSFMTAYPGEAFARLGRKLFSLPHGFRWHDLGPAQQVDARLTALRVPVLTLAPLSALSLLGLWAARRRWRDVLLPAVLIGMQVLVMLLLYVSERQRLLMVPFLVLFACLGLQWAGTLSRPRKVLVAALLAGWVLLFSLPTGQMRDTLHLWAHYQQSDRLWIEALTLRGEGKLPAAAETAAASLAAAPWLRDYSRPAFLPLDEGQFFSRAVAIRMTGKGTSPSDRFDAALLAMSAGQLDEAERLLSRLVAEKVAFQRVYLQSSHPEYYLAKVALRRGDRPAARRWAESALAAGPGDPFSLALLYALSGERRYREEMQRFFSELDAAWLAGQALLEAGEAGAAVAELQTVVRLVPELRRGKGYLAAALGASGRAEQGRSVYADVFANPDPVFLEREILALFPDESNAPPDYKYRRGQILAAFGQLSQGLGTMQAAAEQSGDPRRREEFRRLSGMLRAGF